MLNQNALRAVQTVNLKTYQMHSPVHAISKSTTSSTSLRRGMHRNGTLVGVESNCSQPGAFAGLVAMLDLQPSTQSTCNSLTPVSTLAPTFSFGLQIRRGTSHPSPLERLTTLSISASATAQSSQTHYGNVGEAAQWSVGAEIGRWTSDCAVRMRFFGGRLSFCRVFREMLSRVGIV